MGRTLAFIVKWGGTVRIVRVLGILCLILLLIYIGSYAVLSTGGRYEPFTIGLEHVSSYGWAPRGFVDGYRWKRWPCTIYVPLWLLDRHVWHTAAKLDSGQYPVNWVKPEDVWKIYKANGF
jgi:hypothetical protein